MSEKKIADLCVPKSHYQGADGKPKTAYENIGVVMQNDNGGQYILLKKYISLSGFPSSAESENVLVSVFKTDGRQEGMQQSQSAGNGSYSGGQAPAENQGHGATF